MSLIQRLIIALLPKHWSQAIRANSERSIWDIGGVLYKAVSRGKVVGVYCTPCRALRLMPLTTKAG